LDRRRAANVIENGVGVRRRGFAIPPDRPRLAGDDPAAILDPYGHGRVRDHVRAGRRTGAACPGDGQPLRVVETPDHSARGVVEGPRIGPDLLHDAHDTRLPPDDRACIASVPRRENEVLVAAHELGDADHRERLSRGGSTSMRSIRSGGTSPFSASLTENVTNVYGVFASADDRTSMSTTVPTKIASACAICSGGDNRSSVVAPAGPCSAARAVSSVIGILSRSRMDVIGWCT